MLGMRKQKFKYSIQALNQTDYKLILEYEYPNNLVISALMKVMSEDAAKKMIDNITEYHIPKEVEGQYYWTLHKAILPQIKECYKIFKRDKFTLLDHKVVDATYTKIDSATWMCKVELRGTYVRG